MKVRFNHDLNKQVQEVIFSRKIKQVSYRLLRLINNSLKQPLFQKNVDVHLESKMNFSKYLQHMTTTALKPITT